MTDLFDRIAAAKPGEFIDVTEEEAETLKRTRKEPSQREYMVLAMSMFDGYLFGDERYTEAQADKIKQAYRLLWEVNQELPK